MKTHLKTLAAAAIALGCVNIAYSDDCIKPVTDFDDGSYTATYTAFGDTVYCADSGSEIEALVLAYRGTDGLDDYGEDYRWPVERHVGRSGREENLEVSQVDLTGP